MPSPFFGEKAPDRTDMSDCVVHFTKPYKEKSPYDNMLAILGSGVIRARNAFGICRNSAPDKSTQKAVCFSEIPLHKLSRVAEKRSEYGIVFRKDFVVHRHGNPILYAYKDQELIAAINALVVAAGDDKSHPAWRITPFVDSPGAYPTGSYFFEWEREWREIGDFTFSTDDVAFLIIPEKLHAAAKGFFKNARTENLGPAYACPFRDAHWRRKQIKAVLP